MLREENTTHTIHIHPSQGWFELNLSEMWKFRELLYFLVWRDLKVRYKQTLIGGAWAIVQPFFMMVVFTVFFHRLGGIQAEGAPYPVFAYVGLLPWMYFANSLTGAANVVVGHASILTKLYFPRLLLPISAVVGGLVDFGIAFLVLIGMMLYFGIVPGWACLTLPLFLLLAMLTALGIGLWLSALNAIYRDVRYIVPFLVQFWLFASPVAYASNAVPETWRGLYGLNPMAGVIEGFRWALLGKSAAPGPMMLVSVFAVFLILTIGIFYFRRMEGYFADVV